MNISRSLKHSFTHLATLLLFLANGVCNNNLASVKAASYFSLQKNFIADIVEKAGPAVVFIEIKGRHPVSGKRVTIANGSGFIVRPNGLILTNAHVVANKSTVNVKLHDGSNYEGTVITVDPVADLATVKINTDKKMTVIPLGKSSTIRPGEFVAALGSPLSLHKTATIGIVSSYLRGSKELGMNNSDMEYIQTDATIGLGNSGGPLVNLDGKAIGINTLKLTEGISFAIPSDYALLLLEKADNLISKNASKKPNYLPNGKDSSKGRYVGLTMLPLTGPIIMELKEKYHEFPEINEGVFIHKVVVSSPAYTAGLHAGDIIININDIKVSTSADVYNILEKHNTLKVTVYRGKHKERYTVHTETL
ncbi:Serine protease htra2, mitochondrial [Bulinus truncatus]|nr:Serine protease htra2, mitochondrial [Bulinus truncatus]